MRTTIASMSHAKTCEGVKPKNRGKVTALDSGTEKEQGSSHKREQISQKTAALNARGDPWFTQPELVEYRGELLNWYDNNHRILPWRRTPHSKRKGDAKTAAGGAVGDDVVMGGDASGGGERVVPAPADLPEQQFAYWVWVSEVMLQQTQVATVIPYFKRWVAKWPTVADLAAADIDTVNTLWAGLGYYRRARYLLDGARYVVEKLDGKFPTTAPELLKIPGVGPYTSAAVASIAFASPAAVVDGNVIRVVSRLRALPGDPTKLAAVHAAMASELLDVERPGCYNQALMELGATVCRPVNPNCTACPVRGVCRAAAEWSAYLAAGGAPDLESAPRVTQYPGRKAVKEKREQVVAVTVLEVICALQSLAGDVAASAEGVIGKKPPGIETGQAKAKPQAPRKRQRTMQDFALAAAARQQQQQQQAGVGQNTLSPATAGSGSQPEPMQQQQQAAENDGGAGSVDLEALVARGTRHYLLSMRPQGGLLAGLWEFPGSILNAAALRDESDDDINEAPEHGNDSADGHARTGQALASANATSSAERQRVSDVLLRQILGASVALTGLGTPPAAAAVDAAGAATASTGDAAQLPHTLRVLARHDMGQYIHVFSHIRQTNYIQRVTAVFDGNLETLIRLTGAAVAGATGAGNLKSVGADAGHKDVDMTVVVSDTEVEAMDNVGSSLAGVHAVSTGGSSSAAKKGQGRGKKGLATARGKQQGAAESVEVSAAPIMWASRQQIEGTVLGLSSGVRKIFQQAVGALDGAAGGGRTAKGTAGKGKGGSTKMSGATGK